MNRHPVRALFLILMVSMIIVSVDSIEASASGFNEYYQKVNEQVSFVQTNNSLPGKGSFFLRRIVSLSDYTYWTSFKIPGETGTLRYFDSNNDLIQVPLENGTLPQGRILFLSTEKYHYILGQPYSYRGLGGGTMDSVSSLPVNVRKNLDGWIVEFRYNLEPGVQGILWGAGSPNTLVDFSDKSQLRMWSSHDLDRNARLLYDGYHYKSPTTYYPSTPHSYWRIPSDYLTNSLVRSGGSLASEIMGQSLLKVAHRNINQEGFLPTLPLSNWLHNDYGISNGFFDTRFNGDTIETNVAAYNRFGDEIFIDAARRLAGYYMEHGKDNHYLVNDLAIGEGWLVEDYYNTGGRRNHTSLNHQLQSIHSFLLLYEVDGDHEYLNFAEQMLRGIKITRDKWIMPSGNLEYAYMPDGKMDHIDYEYLTYNDLLNVQDALVRIMGERDADLDLLIASKRIWMDMNSVVTYRK
ncbi:MAG: hypothetical protein ACQEP4_09235 [Bacillota bacterium]